MATMPPGSAGSGLGSSSSSSSSSRSWRRRWWWSSFSSILLAFLLTSTTVLSSVPATSASSTTTTTTTTTTTSSFATAAGSTPTSNRTTAGVSAYHHPKVHHILSPDFYRLTCPQLDQLVSSVTTRRFRDAPASGPATIRLFFHDCFVEGCDASVLVDPPQQLSLGASSSARGSAGAVVPPVVARVMVERDVGDNRDLADAAFETVAEAKAAVEAKCPGVVSCADVLAVAARDFVHLAGGPYYPVKKGRRDSKVSLPHKVHYNLPRSNSTVDDLIRLFTRKGLSVRDLVALSGAHTIGFSHCNQFVDRLYNYRGTGTPDPSLDPRLLKALRMSCPRTGGNEDVVAPFDVQTPFSFDHQYYGNLQAGMGLLATDQALWVDPRTRAVVQELGKDKDKFFQAFAEGMERMGAIGAKRGKKGEVRRVCTRFNSN